MLDILPPIAKKDHIPFLFRLRLSASVLAVLQVIRGSSKKVRLEGIGVKSGKEGKCRADESVWRFCDSPG